MWLVAPRPAARGAPRRRWLTGLGVAASTYPARRMPSTATGRAEDDGSFTIRIAAADIGTGARTVLTQIAADELDVPPERVLVEIGDSSFGQAMVAGGSMGTSSWGAAVVKACRALRAGETEVSVDTADDEDGGPPVARHSFGAQFAEVRVDADTGEVRVPRLTGVFACGRILNPKTARSQFIGGMTMGLGMALFEESVVDQQLGDYVTTDLASYHVPVNADVDEIDVSWIEDEDFRVSPMGSKGIGEIGIVGTAAAVANAVFDATGIRIRDLPITPGKLVDRMPERSGVNLRSQSSISTHGDEPLMQQRNLGELAVPAIGLGCMGMSAFYGTTDEGEAIATIHRALELGGNLFDTAEIYGPHTNEELLGKALAGRRDEAIIATKFGNRPTPTPENPNKRTLDGSAENVRRSIEGSLKRLGTDHVDLYYVHRIDPDTPIEETVGALGELVKEGKVRHIGLSEAKPETIRRAHATHPITALQTEYSLWSRDVEAEILPTVRELGIGFVAYSPLGRGFLSGRFKSPEDLDADDFRRTGPRFTGANLEHNLELVAKVEQLAGREGLHLRPAGAGLGAGAGRRTSSPSRARSGGATWRRTWAPSTSS